MSANPDPTRWLRCYRPDPGARLRLVCFPYAGGSASFFRDWSGSLPSSIEVIAVQLPGRSDRLEETLFTNIKPLIGALVEVLGSILDRPVAFWGHSLGAILGFEIAHQLYRETGRQPAWLFLSGHAAPQTPRSGQPIHLLPDEHFWTALKKMNGIPDEVLLRPELRQVFLPILRADLCMSETYLYLPKPPLPCPISVFGGAKDKSCSHLALSAWRTHTQGRFMLRILPGDHFFINSSRTSILEAIADDLDAISSHT